MSIGLVYLSMLLSMPRCCYLGMNKALFWSNMEAQSAIPLSPAAAQNPQRYIWQINSLRCRFFFATLSSSTTKHTYNQSITAYNEATVFSIINIACIHEDLPRTKRKYIVYSNGKCMSRIVVGVQQGIELQLHVALQQI